MNTTHLRAQGPATRAAHALHDTVDEIAAEVRELRAQAEAPRPSPKVAVEEPPNPGDKLKERIPVAESSPPAVSGSPAAPPSAERASETPAAIVSPPAPSHAQLTLPPVVDLRAELAAFVAGMKQQHEATVSALRQVTELCRSQQAQMVWLRTELTNLASRRQVQANRM